MQKRITKIRYEYYTSIFSNRPKLKFKLAIEKICVPKTLYGHFILANNRIEMPTLSCGYYDQTALHLVKNFGCWTNSVFERSLYTTTSSKHCWQCDPLFVFLQILFKELRNQLTYFISAIGRMKEDVVLVLLRAGV